MAKKESASETKKAIQNSFKNMKTLVKGKSRRFKDSDFQMGQMLFYSYNAKDKEQNFDRTPLVIVLWSNSKHVLGLNLHWCPIPLREILIKQIYKSNKKNIKQGLPLQVDYSQLKGLIYRLKLTPIIRKYIKKRISTVGVNIESTDWLMAAKTRSEIFTGGRASAEMLYKKATRATRRRKQTRGRREHI